ncbi:VOC family protein [Cohnella soli]|uniref:VOC family protein n=1 Tax=Cohnella soli TaxID=425005 RepID=A0ABW0I1K6_9BACL
MDIQNNRPSILNAAAIFFATNRQNTLNYYSKLGFSCNESFGFVQLDGLEFIVHETGNLDNIRPNYPTHGPEALDLFCMVQGVEELYDRFTSRGASIRFELRISEYGMKEFAIQDPDGYSIGFGESLID